MTVNGVTTTSDKNYKKNIENLNYGLDDVLKLKPVSFDWVKTNPASNRKLGLIAQDLLNVIPEVVKTHEMVCVSEEPYIEEKQEVERLGVYYSDIIPVVIKALQEEDNKVEALKQKVKDQQAEIDELKNKIKKLDKLEETVQDLKSKLK